MHPSTLASSPPAIHISPPDVSERDADPFSLIADQYEENNNDLYRPQYLQPPLLIAQVPKHHPRRSEATRHVMSPLAQRENRRPLDLRVALARKAHSSKQAERRARFLAKIGAPPSPDAVFLPPTPPDSPALFHFTLPSPGMTSPLPLFQSLKSVEDPTMVNYRLEQVNFRTQMPSLEEISSRLNLSSGPHSSRPSIALPRFLNNYSKGRSVDPEIAQSSRSPFNFKHESARHCFDGGRDFLTEANLRAWERHSQVVPICCH